MKFKKKIFITGGSGHLGGRLSSFLSGLGHEVSLGVRKKISNLNFSATQVHLDLEKSLDLQADLKGVDVLIHLAALNFDDSKKNPSLAQKINVTGTKKILEQCQKSAIHNVIYFSTIHVYGTPLTGYLEENSKCFPQNDYAQTHLEAEKLCMDFAHENSKNHSVVLRLSNSLGSPITPNVNTWMLLANDLCQQVVRNKKIELKSSGMQWRNFVAIAEVEKIINFMLEKYSTNSNLELPTGIYNFGQINNCRVWELAKLIQSRAQIIFGQEIEMLRPVVNSEEKIFEFSFPLNKIINLGFTPSDDLSLEVDNLLKNCIKWSSL